MSMSISGAVSTSLQMRQLDMSNAIDISVLRKSFDQQTVSMDRLLEALPVLRVPSEAHLGNSIDIRA